MFGNGLRTNEGDIACLLNSFSLHFPLISSALMVGYSEIQRTSPSVAFLFARLGVKGFDRVFC